MGVQGQWTVKIPSSYEIFEPPKPYMLYVIEVHRVDPHDAQRRSGWVVTRRYTLSLCAISLVCFVVERGRASPSVGGWRGLMGARRGAARRRVGRYREFHELHERLRARFPRLVEDLGFPGKRVLSMFRASTQLGEERRIGLEAYLQVRPASHVSRARARRVKEWTEAATGAP
jgi:hypothetical protein